MSNPYTTNDIKKILKKKDAWWTVIVIDRIAIPLTLIFANYLKFITPNILTLLSLLISMTAAYSFIIGHMVQGALLYELSFLLDCTDGKLAILTKRQSYHGLWLDKIADKIRLFVNTIALSLKCCPFLGLTFIFFYLWDEIDAITYENIAIRNNNTKYKKINKSGGFTGFLLKHRLALLPSAVEMDTFAFFIGPLTSVKIGFLIGIIIAMLRKIVIHIHFKFGNALKK